LEIYERLAKANPEAHEAYVAITLNNLAILYYNTQRFDKTEEYYLQVLEIQERLTKAHPEVYGQDYAGCLHNASYFSLQVQNYAQAEEYSQEALKWSDDINIYTNLAAAILLQGRFEEAKQIYLTYKDDLRDTFLEDFQALKDNNAIPEHIIGDVEKIIELLNS
jgi:tetratricopeptide (TPR) repeat protein